MMESIGRIWSREPVGFRRGELTDGDGLALVIVASIGGPALLVGSSLALGGLSQVQILLVAPVAALLGGLVVGASARMAASTGAGGTWLLRPSFGLVGAWLMTVIRLAMVAAWAVIGLQMAGRWGNGVVAAVGLPLPRAGILAGFLGVAALLAVLFGPFAVIRRVIRHPLLWASVVLLAVGAWRIAVTGAGAGPASDGPFWPAVQTAVEMAAVFVPFAQTIGRRLDDDSEAFSTFGVGYTIPTIVVLVAGAIFATRLGGLADLTGLEAGTAGVALAAAWVLVAEFDQGLASFLALGSEAAGVIGRLSPIFVGGLGAVGVIAAAVVMPTISLDWPLLLTSLAFPACLITVADYFLARDRYYSESEIYGAAAGDAWLNVVGIVTWVLAVLIGQVFDPVGPDRWVALMPDLDIRADLPWRLLMGVVAAIAYVVLSRYRRYRTASVYDLRGV
ncbi:MAG TPA: hypothetical protein VJ938_04895 [Acidimicrobiia bacterium]|nr:hypothetical protein [Acidimicrobiia bacterium]